MHGRETREEKTEETEKGSWDDKVRGGKSKTNIEKESHSQKSRERESESERAST